MTMKKKHAKISQKKNAAHRIDSFRKNTDTPLAAVNKMITKASMMQRSGNLSDAEEICRQILKDIPKHADTLHLLGVILHQKGRDKDAVKILSKAIESNPGNLNFYKNIILILKGTGNVSAAEGYMKKALNVQSKDGKMYQALGNLFYKEGSLSVALSCYEKVLSLEPDSVEAANNMGGALHALGRIDESIERYRQTLRLDPEIAETHYNMGNAYKDKNQLDQAIACFEHATAINPEHSPAFYNMGNAFRDKGRIDQAIRCFQQCIQIEPRDIEALYNLGNVFYKQNRLKEAINAYSDLLKLNPGHVKTYNNLGCLFKGLGAFNEAKYVLEKAISIDNRYTDLHINLGNVYKEQNKFTESVSCYESALNIDPNHVDALNSMGIMLKKYGKFEEGLKYHERAVGLSREISPAWWYYYLALPILYDDTDEIKGCRKRFSDGLEYLEKNIDLSNSEQRKAALDGVGSITNFYLQYQGYDDTYFQKKYGRLVCKIMQANFPHWSIPRSMPTLKKNEKVRIGYISSFMLSHTIGTFLMGWLENHDRAKFEIHCYHIGGQSDIMTGKFGKISDHFHHIHGNLELVAEQIVKDDLHVLIFTDIGMYAPATQLAGLRLAPVQCKGWGHPVTTGLPTIDYYISSDLMEPEDAQGHYTEELVKLPNLALAFPRPMLPKNIKRREHFGFKSADFVYLTSQSLFKYLPQHDSVYPLIAKKVINAKIVFIENPSRFVTQQFKKRLQTCFAAHRLDVDDFCVFQPRLKYDDFLNLNLASDVLLDTLSWSGGKTTLEAIGCGLPVVTCPGQFMRGRHAYAMLKMMGVEDTIVDNVKDYINIAVRLGLDKNFFDKIKNLMALNQDKLFNDADCISELDDFYLSLVKKKAQETHPLD